MIQYPRASLLLICSKSTGDVMSDRVSGWSGTSEQVMRAISSGMRMSIAVVFVSVVWARFFCK